MDLTVIAAAERQMDRNGKAILSEEDKDFVVQFAFRTADSELTNRLIDELCLPEKDSSAIYQKYLILVNARPPWVMRIENLLIDLERYRLAEEETVRSLSEILTVCGIPITENEIRVSDSTEIKSRLKKEISI